MLWVDQPDDNVWGTTKDSGWTQRSLKTVNVWETGCGSSCISDYILYRHAVLKKKKKKLECDPLCEDLICGLNQTGLCPHQESGVSPRDFDLVLWCSLAQETPWSNFPAQ